MDIWQTARLNFIFQWPFARDSKINAFALQTAHCLQERPYAFLNNQATHKRNKKYRPVDAQLLAKPPSRSLGPVSLGIERVTDHSLCFNSKMTKPFNALLRDAIEVNITRLKPSGNPVFISLDNPIQQLRAKREIGGAVVKNNGPQSFIFGELNADKRMQIKPRINEHSINMSRFQARYKSAIAGVFLSARDNDRQ